MVKRNIKELDSGLSKDELKLSGFTRTYAANTSLEMQARRGGHEDIHDWLGVPGVKANFSDARVEQVKVTKSLKDWLYEMYQVFTYGFTMSNAKDWGTFKSNARYVKVQM